MARRPRTQTTRTVTLQIQRLAHDKTVPGQRRDAAKFRRGDIIDVMLTPPNATKDESDNWFWNGGVRSGNLGFVHMREVPEDRWQNMRKRFTEPVTEVEPAVPPDTEDEVVIIRQRCWKFDIPAFATARPPKHAELMNDGETTLAWTQARTFIMKKTPTNKYDPNTDLETPVEDEDLPA